MSLDWGARPISVVSFLFGGFFLRFFVFFYSYPAHIFADLVKEDGFCLLVHLNAVPYISSSGWIRINESAPHHVGPGGNWVLGADAASRHHRLCRSSCISNNSDRPIHVFFTQD